MYFEGYDFDLEYGINDVFEWDVGLDNGQSFVKQKPNKKVVVEDPFEMPSDNEVDPPHLYTHPKFREMYHLEIGYDIKELYVGFPLRLLFVLLFLRTNILKGNPVYWKAHRIVKYLKIKTDESEYRTQGTNVSLS